MAAQSKAKLQKILNNAGFKHIRVMDKDTVYCYVDEEKTSFCRSDVYGGHPLSGLATFGSVIGDHRMIEAIAEDITEAFSLIK